MYYACGSAYVTHTLPRSSLYHTVPGSVLEMAETKNKNGNDRDDLSASQTYAHCAPSTKGSPNTAGGGWGAIALSAESAAHGRWSVPELAKLSL